MLHSASACWRCFRPAATIKTATADPEATAALLVHSEAPFRSKTCPASLPPFFCGGIQECLGDLGAIFPQPDCEPTVENEYRNEQFAALEEAIAAGTVVYDGTEAPSCLAAFRALGCDLFSSRVPPACERTLAGTIPLGDPCSLNDECEGNAFCDRSGDSCPGVCAEPRTEGQSRL